MPKFDADLPCGDLVEPVLTLNDDGEIDIATTFGRTAPIEVEVGFGKGRFLLAEASARPEVSFLGIELYEPYVRLVRYRALTAGLTNIRLVRADAYHVFGSALPAKSLDQVHVMFPDPWPKERHRRRRLIRPAFLECAVRALRLGGRLNICTDHAAYWQWTLDAVAKVDALEPAETFAIGELSDRTHFASQLARNGATFNARTWTRTR